MPLRRGAKLEFEDFYRAEYEHVYRVVWVVARDPEQAQDATQEAFCRAYARWRRLHDVSWAPGWVIATALNFHRRASRRRSPLAVPAPNTQAGPDIARLAVVDALRELPPRQRTAVVLHYVADLSVEDVAQAMGVSEGTVKAHLHQGRAAMKEPLGDHRE